MAPNTVHVYSPSETALDAARAIGGYFEGRPHLWAWNHSHGTTPKILAEILSRWGPVIVYGTFSDMYDRLRVRVFRGENGVATIMTGERRFPANNARDTNTAVMIGIPARVEVPFDWGVETVSPYPNYNRRQDYRSKFTAAELLWLFTEFYDKLFPANPSPEHAPPNPERHPAVTKCAVDAYVKTHMVPVREQLQLPADLSIVHDYPKLGDMCEIIYTPPDSIEATLIGGVSILNASSVAEYRDSVSTWCNWYAYDANLRDEDVRGAVILLTPNGTRIYTDSWEAVDCAGITNDGKYVWWFCESKFNLISSDGTQLLYSGGDELCTSHLNYTGNAIGGDVPTTIYRAKDGALWFEMGDACYTGPIGYNSNVEGILTWTPRGNPFLKLALRLSDSAAQDAPHHPRRAPAARSPATREYHASKHALLSHVRCGEMPADGGNFLLNALRAMDGRCCSRFSAASSAAYIA